LRDLQETFLKAQTAFPDFLKQAKPLGVGTFGLAVEYFDHSVGKFLFGSMSPERQAERERMAKTETCILRGLQGRTLNGIQIPALIEDLAPLKGNTDFFATYRMTKVPGHSADWNTMTQQHSVAAQTKHFIQAGRALAHFHQAASTLSVDGMETYGLEHGGRILQLPDRLCDRTNKALAVANDYLQTHQETGVIHADFRDANVMTDGDDNVVGLLDFSWAGRTDNYLTDFFRIPASCMASAFKGYEDVSHHPINPLVIKMMDISVVVDKLDQLWTCQDDRRKYLDALDKHLADISFLTGYTPPALR
jgi:hypothetical protein